MGYTQALRAYQRAQQSVMSPRYMEVTVFARAISMLKYARNDMDDYLTYAAALKYNQKLWTHIQSRLIEGNDKLPTSIQTNLARLSIFIDSQTLDALVSPKAEKLDPLIDINIDISRGLGSVSVAPAAARNDRLSPHGFRPN